MSTRRKRAIIIAACLVLLGAAVLWALPEVVRRVALAQIPKRTGRAVAIEAVDLNLFTGRLGVKGFRLADREGPDPFVAFDRLDVRLSPLALLRSHIHVIELRLVRPSIRIVRTGPAEFNFADLLAGTAAPDREPRPAAGPSGWTLTVDRLEVSGGRVRADDRAVAPPAEWLIHDFGVEAAGVTTRPGAPPGRLAVRARVDEAVLALTADPLRLEPLRVEARLSLDGFETRRLNPYVFIPLGTPYLPKGGRLGLALAAHVDSDARELKTASVSGTVTLDGEALAATGRSDPFLAVSRLGVVIKEADALTRTLTVASVALEGFDLTVRRDARGNIDLLEMFKPGASSPSEPTAPPVAPNPPADPPAQRTLFPVLRALARGFEGVRVERITLAPSSARLVDQGVTPTTTLSLRALQARIEDLTWPVAGPAKVALSTELPGGGTLSVAGPVTLQPFDAELAMAVRNAPVEPYQAYVPVPARLSGRYGGDSQNRIALRDGTLVAISKGNSWAQNVEIRAPGAERPAIRIERMELIGIDLDWPRRAIAARASFRRPRVEIERDSDGAINLRRLFAPAGPESAVPTSEPAPPPGAATTASKPEGLLDTMRVGVGEIRVEDGFVRFLDRTTSPAFSQDLTGLGLTLTGLGNQPGRRAQLALQSVVGGDASLDVRGEVGALGSPAFLELVGELRSFPLPSVDPYAAAATGWVVRKGELHYTVRFKLDGDRLTAENDLVVGQLEVAPASGADEVKQRLGLPLGLIVALVKDQRGDIRATVPVTGPVSDPAFDFRNAIWTAIKNVLVNLVTAPFKAIGRLFSGGETIEEPKIDPVTFAAGSSVLSPAMEDHLLRVADFLRRSPFVNLAMTAASSPADVVTLQGDAVTARLREFQREHGLDDDAATLAAYYRERLPEIALPETVEEQLAVLREREPVPEALLADLARRRVETTRRRLLDAEGIAAARLPIDDATPGPVTPPGAATGEGRVEFGIVAGQ